MRWIFFFNNRSDSLRVWMGDSLSKVTSCRNLHTPYLPTPRGKEYSRGYEYESRQKLKGKEMLYTGRRERGRDDDVTRKQGTCSHGLHLYRLRLAQMHVIGT